MGLGGATAGLGQRVEDWYSEELPCFLTCSENNPFPLRGCERIQREPFVEALSKRTAECLREPQATPPELFFHKLTGRAFASVTRSTESHEATYGDGPVDP